MPLVGSIHITLAALAIGAAVVGAPLPAMSACYSSWQIGSMGRSCGAHPERQAGRGASGATDATPTPAGGSGAVAGTTAPGQGMTAAALCLPRHEAVPAAFVSASLVGHHDRATSRSPTHDGPPAPCCVPFPLPSCADGRLPPTGDHRPSPRPSSPRGIARRCCPRPCCGTPRLPLRVPVPALCRRPVGGAAVGLEASRPTFEPCRQGCPASDGRSLKPFTERGSWNVSRVLAHLDGGYVVPLGGASRSQRQAVDWRNVATMLADHAFHSGIASRTPTFDSTLCY